MIRRSPIATAPFLLSQWDRAEVTSQSLKSNHKSTFNVDFKRRVLYSSLMNNENGQTTGESIDELDQKGLPEKLALLRILRQRVDNVENGLVLPIHGVEQNIEFSDLAGTPGYQALSAGTPPEQSRDTTGTSPDNSANPAGTKRKRKITESPLDDLPLETQALILELMERLTLDAATLEITAQPPYGLGIATSRSSLGRFHKRHTTSRILRDRAEDASRAAKLLAEAKSTEDFTAAATELIKVRLLETATTPDGNPNHLLTLSRALERLRSFEFTERRLRLAESKAMGKKGAASHDTASASPAESKTSVPLVISPGTPSL